jgi:hypothetical protein
MCVRSSPWRLRTCDEHEGHVSDARDAARRPQRSDVVRRASCSQKRLQGDGQCDDQVKIREDNVSLNLDLRWRTWLSFRCVQLMAVAISWRQPCHARLCASCAARACGSSHNMEIVLQCQTSYKSPCTARCKRVKLGEEEM